jgi:membrane protein CcdC involved in cytochrome C biogenesis
MANVQQMFMNGVGVSEILFKHNDGPAVRTGIVSGMLFMSGGFLIFVNQSGNTIRLNSAA